MAGRTLDQQLAAAEAKAARLRHQLAAARRKADTRRKIVVGGTVLATMQADPDLAARVMALLRENVTRDLDRAVIADLLAGRAEAIPDSGPANGPEDAGHLAAAE